MNEIPKPPPLPLTGTRPGGYTIEGKAKWDHGFRIPFTNIFVMIHAIVPDKVEIQEKPEAAPERPFSPALSAAIDRNLAHGEEILKMIGKNPDDMSRTEHEATKAAAYLRLALSHIERLTPARPPLPPNRQPNPVRL